MEKMKAIILNLIETQSINNNYELEIRLGYKNCSGIEIKDNNISNKIIKNFFNECEKNKDDIKLYLVNDFIKRINSVKKLRIREKILLENDNIEDLKLTIQKKPIKKDLCYKINLINVDLNSECFNNLIEKFFTNELAKLGINFKDIFFRFSLSEEIFISEGELGFLKDPFEHKMRFLFNKESDTIQSQISFNKMDENNPNIIYLEIEKELKDIKLYKNFLNNQEEICLSIITDFLNLLK